MTGEYNTSNSYRGFKSQWGNWMFVFLSYALLPSGCRKLISSANPVACIEDISKMVLTINTAWDRTFEREYKKKEV